MRNVTEIKADGPLKVDVTFSRPNIDFLSLVSTWNFGVMPSIDKKVDRQTKDGTGAFILESFEPGRHLLLKRNPNYWDSAIGGFDTVKVTFI